MAPVGAQDLSPLRLDHKNEIAVGLCLIPASLFLLPVPSVCLVWNIKTRQSVSETDLNFRARALPN